MSRCYENKVLDPHRWVIFAVVVFMYFLAYFHRVSTSVLASDLLNEFNASATDLGLMSSMFFYFYSLGLPLSGYFTDKLRPMRVIGLWSFLTAGGCFLFALAPNIDFASFGRALIGLGVAGVYVPGIKAFSQWFSKKDFATMNGILLAVGNLGAIVASAPLAWLAIEIGWRKSFLAIGDVTLVLAFLTLLIVRWYRLDRRASHVSGIAHQTHQRSDWGAILTVVLSRRFWILASISFFVFGPLLSFQGLWATPFFMSVRQLDRVTASQLIMLYPLGYLFGAPVFGRLADRVFAKKGDLLLMLLASNTITWGLMTFAGAELSTGMIIGTVLLMGGTTGGMVTTVSAILRETTPENIFGFTTGILNPFAFLGAAIFQILTGAVLDHFGRNTEIYPGEAYRKAFLLCFVITAVAFAILWLQRRHLGKREIGIPPTIGGGEG